MNSFEWVDATSVEQAAALLAESGAAGPVVAKAGGMDLIDLLKERIVRPSRVVNLRTILDLDTIAFDPQSGLTRGRSRRSIRSSARLRHEPSLFLRYVAAVSGDQSRRAAPRGA